MIEEKAVFVFKFNIEGSDYKFEVSAESKRDAIDKLNFQLSRIKDQLDAEIVNSLK